MAITSAGALAVRLPKPTRYCPSAWSIAPTALPQAISVVSEAQIEDLYLRAYARKPSRDEVNRALADLNGLTTQWKAQLEAQGYEGPRTYAAPWRAMASLCHAVLSSAEFTYID